MNRLLKTMVLGLVSVTLCSCSGFFDKDNTPPPTPLVKFKPEATISALWNVRPNGGSHKNYLKLVPAAAGPFIFTADQKGTVSAVDQLSGKKQWSVRTGVLITAGPAAHEGIVVIGSKEGDVIALHAGDGSIAWKNKASSEIFAPAAIGDGIVLVKAIDGKLSAFAANDGHIVWQYQQTEPTLILRSASVPQIHHDVAVVGFANGNIAELTLHGGNLLWETPLATAEGSFAIQRMIDIDADPVVKDNRIYAATYQGHIGALEMGSGQTIWTHDLSSYTGLTVDEHRVYISDAYSNLWAFEKSNGRVAWHQSQLLSRHITAPVLMGPYIVVGDAEGYLHWIDRNDGHFVARINMNSAGIVAAPIVIHDVLYALSQDGHVAAYRLR